VTREVPERPKPIVCESVSELIISLPLVFNGHEFVPRARRAGWSIVNLSIIVSIRWKALMNVCAMVRSFSL